MSSYRVVPRDSSWLLVWLALFGASACAVDPRLSIRICGDLAVPDEVESVRISMRDDSRMEVTAGVLVLAEGEPAQVIQALPATTSLPRARGSGWVTARALLDGVGVAFFERRVTDFESSEHVDLLLQRDCYQQQCPVGQTCIQGMCMLAPSDTEAPTCPPFGGGG